MAVGSAAARRALLDAAVAPGPPSSAVAGVEEPAALLRIELDVCGAWMTTAGSGGLRSVAVRRAGWVDLRGHGRGPPGDDRIGLGPGDALVVPARPADEDRLLDCLLAVTGRPAAVVAAGADVESVAVLAVPGSSGEEATKRLEAATGLSRGQLQLPGYPLGDLQPDLWHHPPTPPREARLRLRPEAAEIVEVRRLLRRLLASWRLEALLEEGDVELLATETATNAMRHAGTEATVIVRYLGDRVRVEVGDGSSALPQLRTPRPEETGGRGLSLVETLSSRWGVTPTVGGKRVWFEVSAKPSGG
ncbi:MAG TPA: ATP-binding protein [Acidimicrobiales bacterium]|nr:ATP-binding protein [Acidimicrobiales bacterium]